MKKSTDQICGYLGTRNLMETRFHNLLNNNGLMDDAIPVTVGFLFIVGQTVGDEV